MKATHSLRSFALLSLVWFWTGCGGADCPPTDQTACRDSAVWRVDSCGHLAEQVQICEFGCPEAGTTCAPCPPTTCQALGVECGLWPDGCGGEIECAPCSAGGICSPEGTCQPGGWTRAAIASVSAPDQYTVDVTFDPPPGDEVADQLAAYNLSAPEGGLEILSLEWASNLRTLRITTERQRLGVTYELVIDTGEDQPDDLVATFMAADTATFWASDFGDPDFAQYQLVAERAAVGQRCVIYLEQGMQVADLAETVAAFDEDIYPLLTETYTAAPDVDGNGRILLLGLDGGQYYGGYFSASNEYPDDETWAQWQIHSNETDMIYVNAVTGTLFPESVVPHEFTHLLYHQAHGFTSPYWAYHDEGLAECSVGLVQGINQYAIDVYQWDPDGIIAAGLSLVDWTWGSYYNYAQAYLFWTYLAAQTDGPSAYGELFALPTGAPEEVDTWIGDRLGLDMPTALRDNLLANWVQAPGGPYGYAGMIDFSAATCPTVAAGTTSVELEAFAGAFFRLGVDAVDYPGTQGADVVYAGIDAAGQVDLEPPFSTAGGALLVFNTSMDWETWAPQPSGPDLPAARSILRSLGGKTGSPAWTNPPPLGPHTREALRVWRAVRQIARP